METVSGRKLTLAVLPCWENEINSGSSCFHLPSFMLSVGFPLICWIYVLWRMALTESLLFFPHLLSFWASCFRALVAIIISRAAHTPTLRPEEDFAPEKRSSCHHLLCYFWDFSFSFFQGARQRSTRFNNRNSLLFSYKIKSHQKRPLTQSLRWLADLIFSGCELCGGDELPTGSGRETQAPGTITPAPNEAFIIAPVQDGRLSLEVGLENVRQGLWCRQRFSPPRSEQRASSSKMKEGRMKCLAAVAKTLGSSASWGNLLFWFQNNVLKGAGKKPPWQLICSAPFNSAQENKSKPNQQLCDGPVTCADCLPAFPPLHSAPVWCSRVDK